MGLDNIAPPLAEHAQNIRAAAFHQHCANFALNPEDEEEMLSTMKSFFDQDRPHKLGQVALRMLDDYAEGASKSSKKRSHDRPIWRTSWSIMWSC